MKSPRFAQMRCIYRGDKLHAQTSNLWTLCAALNESYPISLRPSGLTSWTFIVTNRKRYEVTCDSVSGRPQKQKAQKVVLENFLESEHALALFRLSLHTHRVCNEPAKPYIARLAAIRGKSENLPRFFASERFSTFHAVTCFFTFVKHIQEANLQGADDWAYHKKR